MGSALFAGFRPKGVAAASIDALAQFTDDANDHQDVKDISNSDDVGAELWASKNKENDVDAWLGKKEEKVAMMDGKNDSSSDTSTKAMLEGSNGKVSTSVVLCHPGVQHRRHGGLEQTLDPNLASHIFDLSHFSCSLPYDAHTERSVRRRWTWER